MIDTIAARSTSLGDRPRDGPPCVFTGSSPPRPGYAFSPNEAALALLDRNGVLEPQRTLKKS